MLTKFEDIEGGDVLLNLHAISDSAPQGKFVRVSMQSGKTYRVWARYKQIGPPWRKGWTLEPTDPPKAVTAEIAEAYRYPRGGI